MTSFWGVVRSKPRQERRADYNLQAQGYETLLPYQNTTNRRSGKLFESRLPLFPGYLFVKMGDYCSRSILSTYGVSQLLTGEGGKAKKIEQNIIYRVN